jgi:hypothetical protein
MAMRASIAVLACVVLCGHAVAEPEKYAVDGLMLGTQLNFENTSYGEYRCGPSDQFDGLTWCQKTGRGTSDTATYSLLHSQEGSILYINRSQELTSLNRKRAEEDLKRLSSNIGELPRVTKMPHRSGFPDGLIAVWGNVTLEQLDLESIKALAERKGLKKGLLIDLLGNFVRSAKVGLPVYRIDGGAGFVWAASIDQKGHGILRFGAVDASKFLLASAGQQPTAQMTGASNESSEAEPELRPTVERVQPKAQPELADVAATILDVDNKAGAAEPAQTEVPKVSTSEIQSELMDSAATIVDPENKAVVESVHVEDARITEPTDLDAVRAPLEGGATTSWWKTVAYLSIVGLLAALTICAVVFYRKQRKADASRAEVLLHRADLVGAAAGPAACKVLTPEQALEKIEAIRQSLLLELTSSPSLVPSPTFSTETANANRCGLPRAEPRSLESL